MVIGLKNFILSHSNLFNDYEELIKILPEKWDLVDLLNDLDNEIEDIKYNLEFDIDDLDNEEIEDNKKLLKDLTILKEKLFKEFKFVFPIW